MPVPISAPRPRADRRDRHAATLAALSFPRYQSAIEAGCATAELGALVASRCDRYLGLDGSDGAVAEARRRLAHLPHARVRRCLLPYGWPKRRADLIVLSGVLSDLVPADLQALARRLHHTLLPGGEIVIVDGHGDTHARPAREALHLFLDTLATLGSYRLSDHRESACGPVLLQRTVDAATRAPRSEPAADRRNRPRGRTF